MGVYLVTNITDTSNDPKAIYIDDIPGRTPIEILPGKTVNLEAISTRNQILESNQLRVHINEGRATADTLGTEPRERIFVDTTIDTLDLTGANFVLSSEYQEDSPHSSSDNGQYVLAVRHDGDGYQSVDNDGDYSSFHVDKFGRLKVRAGFQPDLLNDDGYLQVAVAGLDLNELEVNIQAEYQEDSQHTSGQVGSFSLAVRNDSDTSMVDANGDYAPYQVDSIGRLKVRTGFESSLLGTDGYLQVQSQQEGSWIVDAVQSGTWTVEQGGIWSTRALDGYGLQISSTGSSLDVNVTNTSLEVTQGTTPWTVESTNFPTTVDTDYGTVGSSTLRTAAQIGSSTGAADFGAGSTTGQTLRVVLPTDQSAIPVSQDGTWTVTSLQGTTPWAIDGTVRAEQDGIWNTRTQDGYGIAISSTGSSLDVNVTNTSLEVTQGTDPWIIDGYVSQKGDWTVDLVESLKDDDGYVAISIKDVEVGDLEINVEAEYAEDSQHSSGNVGNFSLAVRHDSDSSMVDADGDYAPFQVDSIGRLKVRAGLESDQLTDDGYVRVSLNEALTNVTVDQGTSPWITESTSTNLPTTVDTDYGTVGSSTLRTAAQIGNSTGAADFGAGSTTGQTLRVVLPTDQSAIPASQDGIWNTRTQDGYGIAISSTGSSLDVNVTNTSLEVTQGTDPWTVDLVESLKDDDGYVAISIKDVEVGDLEVNIEAEYAEDIQHLDGDVGSFSLAVRNDSDSSLVDTDGDYAPFQVDSIGRLKVRSGFEESLLGTDGYLQVQSQQEGDWTVTTLQGTTPWTVESTNLPTTVDTDYGTVGSSTLRVASQLGNAAGAADFGVGSTTGQTLRVVLPTDQSAIPVSQDGTWTVQSVQSGTWSVEAIQSGSWTVESTNLPTTVDTDYGTVGSSTLRTAAQIGNSTGAADFGAGSTTGQTLRVVLPTDQSAIPVSQDGTWSISALQSGIWSVRTEDGAGNAISSTGTSLDVNVTNTSLEVTQGTNPWIVDFANVRLDNDGYLQVAISDVEFGDLQVDVGAEYSEDTQHTSGDTGNFTLGVRHDTDSSLVDTDGDYAPFQVDSIGRLKVRTGFESSLLGTDGYLQVQSQQEGSWTVNAVQSGSWTVEVSNFPNSLDTDYGTVGTSTLRTAAQIGNATGAADFGAGSTTAQTLRVVLPTDQSAIPVSQDGIWNTRTQDGYGIAISSTGSSLDVNVTNTSLEVTQGTDPWIVDFDSTRLNEDGYLQVSLQDSDIQVDVDNRAEYAEDSQHTPGDIGLFGLTVRNDTDSSLVNSDGDYAPFQVDSIGRLKVRTGFESDFISPDGYLEVSAAQYGDWTVTATQGTDPWIVDGTIDAVQSGEWSTNTLDGYGNEITSQTTSDSSRNGMDTWVIKGVPEHFNGTVGTTAVDITPSFTTTAVLITNPLSNGGADLIQVSFDGGSNYFDISKGQSLSLDCEVDTFKIKANGTGIAYQILVTHR